MPMTIPGCLADLVSATTPVTVQKDANMASHDRQWFIDAMYRAKCRVTDVQARISRHIESDEFDSAKMLLTDLADALTDANFIANQFADKFGG